MQQYVLEFTAQKNVEQYLEEYFAGKNIKFNKEKGLKITYSFQGERDVFVHSFSSLLSTVYKLKNMRFEREKTKREIYCACVGAFLSIERENECVILEELLGNETAVQLDGFYNFEMTELRKNWESIGYLTARLYEKCKTDEEFVSLLLYFLDLENTGKEILVNEYRLFDKESELELFPIFEDKRENLIANLFLHRPSEITVSGWKEDKRFLHLINMVGTTCDR